MCVFIPTATRSIIKLTNTASLIECPRKCWRISSLSHSRLPGNRSSPSCGRIPPTGCYSSSCSSRGPAAPGSNRASFHSLTRLGTPPAGTSTGPLFLSPASRNLSTTPFAGRTSSRSPYYTSRCRNCSWRTGLQ